MGVRAIDLTERQLKIIEIVRNEGPITGEQIAERFNLTRATLRPDLAILTMSGILAARPRVGYYFVGKTTDVLLSEKIQRISVNDIKSLPVVVKQNSSVYDAVVMMFLEDVGTLYVVQENGFLTGVVSRKDLLKVAIGNSDIHKIPVQVVMTRMPNIIMTTPEEKVLDAAKKIIEHEIDSLPVVKPVDGKKEQYEIVGRLTKTNLTKLSVELGETT